MSEYLGIKPLPHPAEVCARPGYNLITHAVEHKAHEGCHTYSPIADGYEKISDRLGEVMRLMTTSCPDYTVGDFITARPKCCIYHRAAKTIMEAQETLRVMRR